MPQLSALSALDFDFAACEELAAEFDRTAQLHQDQVGVRPGVADGARADWRGRLAQQFDDRTRICCSDGREIADAMHRAATGLRELAEAAHAENERRAWAREWEANKDEGWFNDHVMDPLFGEDDVPPPPPPPPEPNYDVLAHGCAASRG